MFFTNEGNKKIFCGGKDDFVKAEVAAKSCSFFKEDVEEELVADSGRSCYNCRYRRWTKDSFMCLKDSI